MEHSKIRRLGTISLATALFMTAGIGFAKDAKVPADKFDLRHWKIQLPVDLSGDGKVEEIKVKKIKSYSHPDFFYLDKNGDMVFMAPNKGSTTTNTTNTRSELRYMLRGKIRASAHTPQRTNLPLGHTRIKSVLEMLADGWTRPYVLMLSRRMQGTPTSRLLIPLSWGKFMRRNLKNLS